MHRAGMRQRRLGWSRIVETPVRNCAPEVRCFASPRNDGHWRSPRNDAAESGRAAHIGFAAADHALGGGLGGGLGKLRRCGIRGRACFGVAAAEPGFRADVSSASDCATLSTAPNECSAPVPAMRTSYIPGVIGASIFSPRPARGYRFHSLHVEIMFAPRQSKSRYQLDLILQPAASNSAGVRTLCLANGSAPRNDLNLSRISGWVMGFATHPPQNPTGCCRSASRGPTPIPATAAIITSARSAAAPDARACGKRARGGRSMVTLLEAGRV